MYKLSGTRVETPINPGNSPNPPFSPFFARGQDQSEVFHDEIDETPEFGMNTHHEFQLPIEDVFDDVSSKRKTHSNRKQTPSKQISSKIGHTEYSIDSPQPPYLIGAAISPAIIPLTYYPIRPTNFGAPTTNGGNSKKSSSNNRPKPLKKPLTESHQKVVPFNAVPLVWYPDYPVYSSNSQRVVNPSHSTLHATTKSPVIRQPSKQSNQIQTMNLAAYYGYLNHLNSKQKHPS